MGSMYSVKQYSFRLLPILLLLGVLFLLFGCQLRTSSYLGVAFDNETTRIPCADSTEVLYPDQPQFTTMIQDSTVEIVGADNSTGTGFIVSAPLIKESHGHLFTFLVTASHVLERMPGDWVTIRFNLNGTDTHKHYEEKYRIRYDGMRLWTSHPKEDLSVSLIGLTSTIMSQLPIVTGDVIATDNILEHYGVSKGDLVYIVGYPHSSALSNSSERTLHSGIINSISSGLGSEQLIHLVNSDLSHGDSGGPVFIQRGDRSSDKEIQLLFGVVSGLNRQILNNDRNGTTVAYVVPAKYILETIEIIPFVCKIYKDYGTTVYPGIYPKFSGDADISLRKWYFDSILNRVSTTITKEDRDRLILLYTQWLNAPTDNSWQLASEYLSHVMSKYKLECLVKIKTFPKNDASIYYKTEGAFERGEPASVISKLTPCEEKLSCGRYFFWSVRGDVQTSKEQYKVLHNDIDITIYEEQK